MTTENELFSEPQINQEKTIGAVIVTMDRTENAKQAIKACQNFPQISEVIVLDFGSKIPFKIDENDSTDKVRIHRVESPYWHLSKAYNIAIQLCRCDVILKLDSDHILLDGFFDNNTIEDNEYISGSNIYDGICGFLMIHRKDFFLVNGYNENIVSYGYEDEDFNKRLKLNNLKQKFVNRDYVKHLSHNKSSSAWFSNDAFGRTNKGQMVSINKKIAQSSPWTHKNKMSCIYDNEYNVSAVVCCMNRHLNLLRSIDSWLQIDAIKEIILLDYGSKESVKNLILEHFDSSKIKFYRYDAEYWHLTKAYNIAIQLASHPVIAKLDCDYTLTRDFFQHHTLQHNQFITGNHCNNQSLWGFLLVLKKHFLQVNGYNERIVGWGHDDIDINQRLKKIGLRSKTINTKYIKHLPHSNNKNQYAQIQCDIQTSRKSNIETMQAFPWTLNDKMSTIDDIPHSES